MESKYINEFKVLSSNIENSVKQHSIWNCFLVQKLNSGTYNRYYLSKLFEQHYQYSFNFTRLLCLASSRMDNPKHRAVIIENLYEEVGEEDIDQRHSEIMKRFLSCIGVNTGNISIRPFTSLYIERCIAYLSRCDAIEAASFLAWGTEGIVPNLYQIFIDALKSAGLTPEEYFYFSLHIECDDSHHESLANIVQDLFKIQRDSESFDYLLEKAKSAALHALTLREAFFNELYNYLESVTLLEITESVLNQYSPEIIHPEPYVFKPNDTLKKLYWNFNKEQDIDFTVHRTHISMEVIDPRILTISPNSRSESHRHAHESFFYVLSGEGKCFIGNNPVDITPGAMVHVPRWVEHHTQNTTHEPLRILAITDYCFTRQFGNNSESSYRKSPEKLGEAVIS